MLPKPAQPQINENDIANLLSHHYGDGTVYLPAGSSKQLFFACIQFGYVSEEGMLTKSGRALLTKMH